jgi:hypothetical protein
MAFVVQPRFGEQHYPIGRLVLRQAQTLGLTRTMIVRRLGYADIFSTWGLRHLETSSCGDIAEVLAAAADTAEELWRQRG